MARREDDEYDESDGIGIGENGFLEVLDDLLVQFAENGLAACRVVGVHHECTPCNAMMAALPILLPLMNGCLILVLLKANVYKKEDGVVVIIATARHGSTRRRLIVMVVVFFGWWLLVD